MHFSACTKRCVPPHPLRSAQHLPPSGGRLLLSCISSCLTNLTNDRTQPRLIPASNHAPWQRTAQLDAGLAKPDQGGKQEANGGKLAFIRAVQAFTCHGAAVPPPILIQLTFTSHTGSLLLSSLKKVTSPFVPRPLLGTAAGIGKTVETFLCIYAVLYCEKVTLYPHFRDNLRGKVVDNLDNKVGITFTIHSGFPPLK